MNNETAEPGILSCTSVALIIVLGEILWCTIRVVITLINSSIRTIQTEAEILAQIVRLWLLSVVLLFKILVTYWIAAFLRTLLRIIWVGEAILQRWRAFRHRHRNPHAQGHKIPVLDSDIIG